MRGPKARLLRSKLCATVNNSLPALQLRTCRLDDCITLNEAAELLPTSLQELTLTYSGLVTYTHQLVFCPPIDVFVPVITLVAFQRLCKLKKLVLYFAQSMRLSEILNCLCNATYSMHKLQHIALHHANFGLAPGHSLQQLFPVIQSMLVTVHLKSTNATEVAAALLQHVHKLTLHVKIPIGQRMFVLHHLSLVISKTSVLYDLQLYGHNVSLTLQMHKCIKLRHNESVSVRLQL